MNKPTSPELASGSSSTSAQPRLRTAALAVGGCIAITIVVFGAVVLLALAIDAMRDNLVGVLSLTLIVHAILCLFFLVQLLRRTWVSPAAIGVCRPTWRLAHLLWQIPSALIILVAIQATMFAVLGGEDPIPGSSTSEGMAGLSPVFALAGFIGIAVLTPLWEELLFRGVLLSSMRQRWGPGIAVVASSVIFAIVHGIPILLPYMLGLGLVLGGLRIFHGNLWAPLAMHITINSIASATILAALV